MKTKCVNAIAGILMLILSQLASATPPGFQKLYDHYFPKNSEYLDGFYRRSFDATLFGPPPRKNEDRHSVYYAFRGEPKAFHRFAHHPDRDAEGEFALTWNMECLVLLLRLGDHRFSDLLAREDRQTREAVGSIIDCHVDWTKHQFPKTRSLYSYRYISPSHQAFEKKHGHALSKLIASVAAEPRFSGVRFHNDPQGPATILITAPKSLSQKDRADLHHLIRQHIGEDGVLIFD
jgi:hypothetical protein